MILRQLLIALFCVLFGFMLANFTVKGEDDALESLKDVRASYFAELDEKADDEAEIVIVGDSVLAALEWAEEFPDTSIANRAISGQSALEVEERLDELRDMDGEIYVVMLGINDLGRGRSVEDTFESIETITSRLKGDRIVLGVPPCSPQYTDCDQGKVDALNARLETLAKVTFIPTTLKAGEDLADMVHPNLSGLRKLADMVRDGLMQIEG